MTGDRDTLTDEERAAMNCDCAEPYGWEDHADSCLVPVVESIVAARVRAVQAQALRDAAKKLHSTNSLCYPEWLIERANQLDPTDEFQNPED